jgi:hypothetical protein
MTRVNYLSCNGMLVSQEILCGTKLVQIVIDPTILEYKIESETDTLKTGQANTLTSLKKKAKQAVIDLGAKFHDELRNSGRTERFEL